MRDEVADGFAEGDHAVIGVYDVEMGGDDGGRLLGRTGSGGGRKDAPKGQYDGGGEQGFHGMKNRTKVRIFRDISTNGEEIKAYDANCHDVTVGGGWGLSVDKLMG